MLTGDFEHDKAELLRLIDYEKQVKLRCDKAWTVAAQSQWRYEQMLRGLIRAEAKRDIT